MPKNNKTKIDKQNEINNLIKKILIENPFSDIEIINYNKKAQEYCEALDKIFVLDDNDTFRPHFFEVTNWLSNVFQPENFLYTRTSTLSLFINNLRSATEKLLDNAKIENINNDSIKRYCEDLEFRYNVDMFFLAILHEIVIFEAKIANQRASKKIERIESRFQASYDSVFDSQEQIEKIKEDVSIALNDIESRKTDIEKSLENISSRIEQAEKDISNAIEKSNSAVSDATKAFEKSSSVVTDVTKAVEESKGVLPNLLTIMGIFVAIIIAIVAVYLSLVLDSVSVSSIISLANSIPKRIMLIVFLCAFVFNLLFAFIYWISKLANKSIAATCSGCDNSICQTGKCNFVVRTWKRYWNFFVINIFFVLIIAICCLPCWSNNSNQTVPNEMGESATESTYTEDYSVNGTITIQQDKIE